MADIETVNRLKSIRLLITIVLYFCVGARFIFNGPWNYLCLALGGAILAIAIAEDRTRWWLILVMVPAGKNFLAEAANGGKMPISPQWTGLDPAHCVLAASTHFRILCDIHPLPWHLGFYSAGDAVLTMGVPLVGLLVTVSRKIVKVRP